MIEFFWQMKVPSVQDYSPKASILNFFWFSNAISVLIFAKPHAKYMRHAIIMITWLSFPRSVLCTKIRRKYVLFEHYTHSWTVHHFASNCMGGPAVNILLPACTSLKWCETLVGVLIRNDNAWYPPAVARNTKGCLNIKANGKYVRSARWNARSS